MNLRVLGREGDRGEIEEGNEKGKEGRTVKGSVSVRVLFFSCRIIK